MKHMPSFVKKYFLGQSTSLKVTLFLVVLYLATHLFSLAALPVFADEAIYIRWAQLILDEPLRYFFFALNDGKTPLFIWLLVPLQLVFSDQLYAGRILGVGVGLLQMLSLGWLTRVLGGKQKAQWLVMLMGVVLPFWFFHHRLALIDGLLSLFLTWYVIGLARLVTIPISDKGLNLVIVRCQFTKFIAAIWAGFAFGLALWTKLPAILFIPVALVWPLWPSHKTKKERWDNLVYVCGSLAVGLVIFASLRISPAFGQLFARGGDFLFPLSEVLGGKWRETLPSLPTYIGYLITYAHPVTLTLLVIGLFSKQRTRTQHILFWSAILFAVPIVLMGKVVYARYFLPIMIFATVGSALYWEELFETQAVAAKSMITKTISGLILALLLANVIGYSFNFMNLAWNDPNQLPLVSSDRVQYLTEWSSGHGIIEARDFIRTEASQGSVAVATEGFFGTLPDGLLLYFHRRPTENIYIEGIGQPIRGIPDFFKVSSAKYQKKYLVVNSHRMFMELDKSRLLQEYCRPGKSPCLQIWDITF